MMNNHDRALIDFTDEDTLYAELMESYRDEVGDAQPEVFRIDTMDKASWASRKLLEGETRRRTVQAWAQREIDRIRRVLERHENDIDQREGFLKGELQRYLRELRESGEIRKKSLELPGGTIGERSGKDKITIEDEDAVIEQLEAAGERTPIKIKKSVLKTPLAKVTQAQGGRLYLNGQPLDGCFVEPAEDHFHFKPDLPGE